MLNTEQTYLQQIHASTTRRQPPCIRPRIPDREVGDQLLKPQERRPRTTGRKAQQLSALFLVERIDDLPERLNDRMFVIVEPTVVGIPPEIVEIDGRVDASNEDLDFLLVEHSTVGELV